MNNRGKLFNCFFCVKFSNNMGYTFYRVLMLDFVWDYVLVYMQGRSIERPCNYQHPHIYHNLTQ